MHFIHRRPPDARRSLYEVEAAPEAEATPERIVETAGRREARTRCSASSRRRSKDDPNTRSGRERDFKSVRGRAVGARRARRTRTSHPSESKLNWLYHGNGPTRLVRYHTLAERRRQLVAPAVTLYPAIKSTGGFMIFAKYSHKDTSLQTLPCTRPRRARPRASRALLAAIDFVDSNETSFPFYIRRRSARVSRGRAEIMDNSFYLSFHCLVRLRATTNVFWSYLCNVLFENNTLDHISSPEHIHAGEVISVNTVGCGARAARRGAADAHVLRDPYNSFRRRPGDSRNFPVVLLHQRNPKVVRALAARGRPLR
ncbi:hypothetical protein EVAR_94537_1 [Eumeta japonica]|uniref:Uncharacterized protein n=1 Tax=Eumeta variegata TaxID=151549 RepID=A0A4C1UUW0_EUMVA|nr:hypothetical protein EVAR_94537_1 [Eumeta japonica]